MDKERLSRLISFDGEDTSTGFVDVSRVDKEEPINTIEELTDFIYDFLRGKCSATIYTEEEDYEYRFIDLCLGFPGAAYNYYIFVDAGKGSTDKELIGDFVSELGHIVGLQNLKELATECGGLRGYCKYDPHDDKYLSAIRIWCRELYLDLINRV